MSASDEFLFLYHLDADVRTLLLLLACGMGYPPPSVGSAGPAAVPISMSFRVFLQVSPCFIFIHLGVC